MMVPAYHDAVTTAVFACYDSLAIGYGLKRSAPACMVGLLLWATALVYLLYLLAWLNPL